MTYNEREYFQHQCDSVRVQCENQAWWTFLKIISHGLAEWNHTTWYSNFVRRRHLSQFPCECKKKSFPCVAKKPTGQRWYCHAVVSSWAIKHFDFHNLAAPMLWFMDLMWPRVFRRSNVGLVIVWARVVGSGFPCALVFVYKSKLYWGCTTQDHDRYWC